MCPRLKRQSDEQLAGLVAMTLLEAGPDAVTFAQIAQQCGLAPPTLVQRFGTREGMLAAAAAPLRAFIATSFSERPFPASPLETLRSALCGLALRPGLVRSIDASISQELRKQISFRLAGAMESGELVRCDIAPLARALQIAFYGAVLAAAAEGNDPAAEVSAALDAQLSIYV